ncbi:MAG: tRNA glutamyl-Q(34) synthetase GluQRS [Betaproteobacteria bacterium]
MTTYRGRFAPTPSGPLHFGSMVAAVGSFLDARSRSGIWLVRIDDLDPPRTVPGTAEAILRCLDAFSMYWDGAVVYQSTRNDAYHAALHQLRQSNRTYPCACSRTEINDTGLAGVEGTVYPGTCRNGLAAGREARALRVRTEGAVVEFDDGLQGHTRQALQTEIGDFVVYRADHVFAYHLACAVDDAEQGITDVVRGADLIASTPRQIHLQKLLRLPTPAYLHLPLAVNGVGEKLSKQTRAPAVDPSHPTATLERVLRFLGHTPPAGLAAAGIAELWQWAVRNWQREGLPRVASITVPDG